MSSEEETTELASGGPTRRTVELLLAAAFLGFAALLVTDAMRIGHGWASDGPQPGFYPFWIGLALGAAAVVVMVQQLRGADHRRFVSLRAGRDVLAMLVPSCLYVGAIFLIGFYVASALFLAAFMRVHGGFASWKVAMIALGVPLLAFALFELWFKVPLPKGPIEAWLGF